MSLWNLKRWFCALVVGTLTVDTVSSSSHSPWTIPTGHCDPICTCQMDGLYYGEGESWTRRNEPCATYQCNTNGTVDVIKKGCLYKDQCKDINTTWTDLCNKFTCEESSGVIYYTLKEAGCRKPNGECLRIGENLKKGCNLMECQLDGATLALNTIKTGCFVDGVCRETGSYWHDGCTVYTCMLENNKPVTQTLVGEVMQWPDGNYALLKPDTGCPKDVPALWSEGSRLHYSTGRNYFSNPLLLSGNYTSKFMRHEFCVHGIDKAQTIDQQYKTYWEPGSYCIMRRNGNCPRGFLDGYLMFDDKDKVETSQPSQSGSLPDGDYSPDTGLYFCCRSDGKVHKPIVLPKEDNFVLFMNKEGIQCQSVRGMSHKVKFFTFNGDSSARHQQRGHVPSMKIANGDVTIYFCHYTHQECDCKDTSGVIIPGHMEKEINCTVKRCRSEKGRTSLEIVSGGCSANDTCKPEGTTWSEFYGESCIKKTCARVVNNEVITFEIQESPQGCTDGELCQDIGTEIYKNCYTSQCVLNETSDTASFVVKSADCPWLETCKAPNATWEHNCMIYECSVKLESGQYKRSVGPISHACVWKDKCYKQDDIWADGCVDYKCIVTRQNGRVNWSVQTARLACKDFDGNCLAVDEEIVRNCVTYKCSMMAGNRIGLEVIAAGCDWNATCKPEKSTWNDTAKCIEYQCEKTMTDGGALMQVSIVRYGCVFNNTCKEVDSTWSDGCKTRKCVITRRDRMLERNIAAITAGCDDEGICRDVGFIKKTKTCMEYKCMFNETYRDAFFSLVSGECQATDGTCQPVGSQWTEKKTNSCIRYECKEEMLGYVSKALEQQCLDADNQCVSQGTTGFPAFIEGTKYTNCSCTHSLVNNQLVSVKC